MSSRTPARRQLRWARGVMVLSVLAATLAVVSVVHAAPAQFTEQTPAPGSSTNSLRPIISVKIYDPAGPRSDAVTFKLDGRSYSSKKTMLSSTTMKVTYTPTTNLARGLHTVEVSELNWAGVRYSTSWSFRVGEPPRLDLPTPQPGSTATNDRPTVSARVSGGTSGIASVVTIDGVVVGSAFDPVTSLVTAALSEPLANDASHAVTVTVTNVDGLSAELAWSFSILTQPRMPDTTVGQPCQQCHPGYPVAHDMTDCNKCHGYDGPVGGFYTNPPDYHPPDDPVRSNQMTYCGSCHTGTFPTVPMHVSPIYTAHNAGTGADPCKPCHVSDLLAEHYYRTPTNDCMLCHGSADPAVQTAISTGNTACTACHDGNHGGSHDSDVANQSLSGSYPRGPYGPFACTTCHEASLTTEHFKTSSSSAAAGCLNCHPSPRNTLTPAWAEGCVQNGCHPDGSASMQHGLMTVAHMPLAENASCTGCHTGGPGANGDLGAIHVNANDGTNSSCFVCHTSTGPPETKDCVTCHPDRIEPHGYDPAKHQSNVASNTISGAFPSGGTYGPVRCDACHLTELGPEHQRTTSSAQPDGCDSCHPSPRDTLTPWAKSCVQAGCHPVASPTSQHAQMATAHSQPPANSACTGSGCHDEGDLAAVHENAPTQCLACHSTVTVPAANVCTECHGTPHGDVNAAHTADEPGGMYWANTGAYAACTQCHYLDIRAEHAKASSGSLGCPACHSAGGPVSTLPGGSWNKHCSACHTSIHPEYDAEHVAYGQDCNGCHGDPEDARDFHRGCGASPAGGWTPNQETLACHTGPDYVPYPRLGPPYTNGFWCRTCHPEE